MTLFTALNKFQMIKSSDLLWLFSERKVTKHTEWVYQGKNMSWYLRPSFHGRNYHSDFKSMITVHPEVCIWSRKNSPPYNISCFNSFYWQRAFSMGNVVLEPPKIRWVTQIFLKFFPDDERWSGLHVYLCLFPRRPLRYTIILSKI